MATTGEYLAEARAEGESTEIIVTTLLSYTQDMNNPVAAGMFIRRCGVQIRFNGTNTLVEVILSNFAGALEDNAKSKTWSIQRHRVAVRVLLGAQKGLFTRVLRERIMVALLTVSTRSQGRTAEHMEVADWTLLLCLMVKVMQEPTFYKV